ncbi:kinesin family member 11 [Microdochium nivale]|nr:kinesin family member 11 [Microdochium nivale]
MQSIMPPIERDAPVDAQSRHQHSNSFDHSRALVPMWDSSDPERAPPPLPLNPQSPGVSVSPSRIGTSLAIQNAHAAMNERVREAALVPTLVKRMTVDVAGPPERALVPRPSPHKRMQSLQPTSVRDLSLMIEGSKDSGRSTPQSPEKKRPTTPFGPKEPEKDIFTTEKENTRPESPAMSFSLTPVLRPSARRAHHSILGENTPPQSATMLALHNHPSSTPKPTLAQPATINSSPIQVPPVSAPRSVENPTPFSVVTNQSSATPKGTMPSADQLSSQILSLTNIATALQKEMSQLSRRSRDNATDLMSLKEATHARDEDIRKSLRELVTNIDPRSHRDPYDRNLYNEQKAQATSPKISRAFAFPRVPSPNSFMDNESMLSVPSLVGGSQESPASIALLEKILREMGTRDGQDSLLGHLAELADRLTGMASVGKVEELIRQLQSSHERAMIPTAGGRGGGGGGGNARNRNVSFDDDENDDDEYETSPRDLGLAQTSSHASMQMSSQSSDMLNDDLLRIIRSVKDSVAQGGGMTAEVKALVRELRGEVLGMGRDIARKLDEVDIAASGKTEPASKTQVSRIVEEGLDQMKSHMNQLLREHRRASAASSKSAIDYEEIYNAMSAAITETRPRRDSEPDISREDVIQAVKDAWEEYKPEIQIEQIGLERDEVLACLKEGLATYTPSDKATNAASREDVYEAVARGLESFVPPRIDTPASMSKDEIVEAVRECLEEFEFPVASSGANNEITKKDMLDAVQQGLSAFEFPNLNNAIVPRGSDDTAVIERLQDIMQFMQEEFQAISEEAKQNVAANGRDTEQVLDATRDGMDQLRHHMESYVDRVSATGGQEEIMANLAHNLDSFRDDLSILVGRTTDASTDALKQEIESLRDAVNSALVPHVPQMPDNREALETIQDGIERVRQELLRPHAGTTDILDALHEGFSDLRAAIERIGDKPADLTANDEILDALKSGLGDVRTEIDSLRDNSNEKAIATIGSSNENALIPMNILKQDDIKNLEVMMTDLQTKVNAMDSQTQLTARYAPEGPVKVDLTDVEELLRDVHGKIASMATSELEETLRNLQASIASMEETIANLPSRDSEKQVAVLRTRKTEPDDIEQIDEIKPVDDIKQIDEMEQAEDTEEAETIEETKNVVVPAVKQEPVVKQESDRREFAEKPLLNGDDAATKEDIQAIEDILRNTKARLEEAIDGEQAVRKDHVDAIEALVLEAKDTLGDVVSQLEAVTRKEDLVSMESLVTQINLSFDEMKERAEKSLEDPEKVTKTDVDAIEASIMDLKAMVEHISGADLAALPTKDDLKNVEILISDMKDSSTTAAEASSKALDERQAEIAGVCERVSEVKTFLEEFKGLVNDKLGSGVLGVEALGKVLEGMSEVMSANGSVGTDLKEMLDLMKTEFEESKSSLIGAKMDTDEKFQLTTDVLGAKIDEKIGELATKYDEFQLILDDRATAGEARDLEMDAAITGTKTVTDELKVLVDTLGTAVTESLEKMELASQTVFDKTELLYSKAEENHIETKGEHQSTRDQVLLAINAIEGLSGDLGEVQPQILESVKEILEAVGQNFENTKLSIVGIEQKIEENKPVPPEKYDDTEVVTKLDKLIEGKYDDAEVRSMLDTLATHKYDDAEIRSMLDTLATHKYDDAELRAKIEELIEFKYDDAEIRTRLDALLEGKYDDSEVRSMLAALIEAKYNDADVHTKLDALIDGKYDDVNVHTKLDALIDGKYDDVNVHTKLDALLDGKYDDINVHTKLDALIDGQYDDANVQAKLDALIDGKYDDANVHVKLDAIIDSKYDDVNVHTKLDALIDGKYDDANVHTKLDALIDGKYDDSEVKAKLEALVEAKYDDTPVQTKLDTILESRYDDSEVRAKLDSFEERCDPSAVHGKLDNIMEKTCQTDLHTKLDRLVGHAVLADKAFSQLQKIDRVHAQVTQTAAELTTFLSSERQRIADDHEEKAKALEQTTLALERQRAEQLHVEVVLADLRDEEARLRESIMALRSENDSLSRHRTRLTGDVSSLETALDIRREELHAMDARAEGLERRILQGVLDHSRSMLITKSTPKGRDTMSRKRVPGARSSLTPTDIERNRQDATPKSKTPSQNMVNMAVAGSRTSLAPSTPASASRRIASLSQITGNTPAGGFNRSQSVRTPGGVGLRKRSWAGSRLPRDSEDFDKENIGLVSETDEESRTATPEKENRNLDVESEATDSLVDSDDDGASEAGTLRRSSLGTTVVTDANAGYDDQTDGSDSDDQSDWTESNLGTASVKSESVGDDESIVGEVPVMVHNS